MPEDLGLSQFREGGRLSPAHAVGDSGEDISHLVPYALLNLGNKDASLPLLTQFKDDRFVPSGLMIATKV
jgi:hypothetical protein